MAVETRRRGRLAGKVALITGAARGQGAVEAHRFVEEGASVLVTDVRDELGNSVAAGLGPVARYQHLDVAVEEDWERAVAVAEEHFGPVDVLVNNAAIMGLGAFEALSVDDFRRVVDTNQLGCFLGMRAVAGSMRRAGRGSIVNISSVQGLVGMRAGMAYVATKFAIRGMTKVAAIELGGDGIRVNSVHPGGVDTDMSSDAMRELGIEPGSVVEDPMQRTPLGRLGRPDEIAEVVVFLASEEASYCTGAELVVDGGWTSSPGF